MKKSVLITGASGNLGGAVVKKFQNEDYHVHAVARDAMGLDGAEVTPIDLTNEAAVNEYIEKITTQNSSLRTAVLLVGGFAAGNLKQTDGAALQKMYQLNFETAYFVVRALLPYFEQNGGGHFVLIGTRAAFTPKDAQHLVAYGLSKSLVMYLSEIINAYGKGKGITASVIVPSTIDTPPNREAMPNADFSKWTTAEAIADTIHYLLTDSGKHLRETVLKMYNEA
jgi:NAD(P)-dependent dehydrogenase (short-subunit alcohol dehydrogenase family)